LIPNQFYFIANYHRISILLVSNALTDFVTNLKTKQTSSVISISDWNIASRSRRRQNWSGKGFGSRINISRPDCSRHQFRQISSMRPKAKEFVAKIMHSDRKQLQGLWFPLKNRLTFKAAWMESRRISRRVAVTKRIFRNRFWFLGTLKARDLLIASIFLSFIIILQIRSWRRWAQLMQLIRDRKQDRNMWWQPGSLAGIPRRNQHWSAKSP